MAIFIKPGFWEKKGKAYEHWLNLDKLIKSLIISLQASLPVSNATQTALDSKAPLQAINDTSTATASNEGKTRYYVSGNSSFLDIVMQTGESTYTWVNIVSNNW
jgi:hypothetical protein